MFCTNCGSQFDDGNSFCPNCGTKVVSVAQPVAEPAPVAAPVESAPVQAAPVESAPVQAAPVEAAPVQAVPVAAVAPVATPVEPAPAPAPAPVAMPVQPVAPVQPVSPVYAQPTPITGTLGSNDSLGKTILVLGIVAVACCVFYFFSLASIVCGAIGLSKAKKFTEECGQLYGVAKVGKYLSLGGLIGGSVITGIVALYFFLIVLGAAVSSR